MKEPTPTRFSDGFVQPNRHIMSRLEAIRMGLLNAYYGGCTMSAATKGTERELFVDSFLSEVFPPHFRFGSGDITDSEENKSGQLDIVMEYPNLYSFPMGQASPRLYLAESVAAVIEVKSNLSAQWSEVEDTAKKTKLLKRRFEDYRMRELADRYDALDTDEAKLSAYKLRETASCLNAPPEKIPMFVVGYTGWARSKTISKRLCNSPIDAVLQLDNQFFVVPGMSTVVEKKGPICLMVFLEFITGCLHDSPPQTSIFHYATQAEPDVDVE